MNIEFPVAFNFIMQDDTYLLNTDKSSYHNKIETVPAVETVPVKFNYLGGNKKKFLIVVRYPDCDFIDNKHFAALENALKRLGFGIDDIAIFNSAKFQEATLSELEMFFNPLKMLVLGKKSLPLNSGSMAFNELKQINSRNTLFTFSFDEMMDNIENKKIFWEKLKQL